MDAASRGATALEAGNCAEAIKEYTAALKQNPKAVDYYLKRSTAYQRSTPPDYAAALKDAEIGLHYAYERAKRELIGQAHMRRVTVLFNLGQYANAQFVLEFVKKFDPGNKTIAIWETKIASKLKALPEDDENRKVSTVEKPTVDLTEGKEESKPAQSSAVTSTPDAPKKPVQTPPSQIKHDWYQNKDNVYFSLLARGVPQDKAVIDIEEHSISITFPTATGSDYNFTLDPLFAAIDVAASTSRITPSKVELTLKKKEPGRQWKTLEGTEAPKPSTSPDTGTAEDPVRKDVLASAEKAPSYPTSSKSGPKNWDKVVKDMTKKPKKADGDDGEDGGMDLDDDLDDYGGDEANLFFKKLYAGADPDTQRAMMKSYIESNGTVLSTNWAEVGKRKVETSPPDGMVAKKWGE
ncbi:uncharacterized protein PV09_07079 [Verruconis gallopava]|uniref:SGS-domain-containing protein n=1 Tax=Verruconis gallopava TaxID=253628 RepID=A0A0D1YLB6_9PEZI|nr:uncharacterized protein PV09_07079 [Verruconis gallopava]KIW01607.1 hypothetical protein PV09_07079 [Verruconis gallopava]